jgi:hypothetical protein
LEELQATAAEKVYMGPAERLAEARGRDASCKCGWHVNSDYPRFEH